MGGILSCRLRSFCLKVHQATNKIISNACLPDQKINLLSLPANTFFGVSPHKHIVVMIYEKEVLLSQIEEIQLPDMLCIIRAYKDKERVSNRR